MKTKYIYIILISILPVSGLFAQYKITGVVKDKTTREGIEYVTSVIMGMDSTIVTGCTTVSDGSFILEVERAGKYMLSISFVGYKPYVKAIEIREDDTLGEILLDEDSSLLNELVVVGTRPFVEQKIDRYVVNVSGHLLSAGRNGMDILRQTPGLLVRNRQVTVMGDNVDVWINGKPSRMDQATLASYLEGLQAEDIDQIEVITNPSSKYDAGGGKGIINIKLKKNRNLDVVNGSVNTGYQVSKRHMGIGGISLNYAKEKFSLYGSYNIRGGNDTQSLKELTENSSVLYDKFTKMDTYRALSNNYRAGIDFTPDRSNVFGFLFNGFDNNNHSNINSKTSLYPAQNGTSLSLLDGSYKNRISGQTYNLNYKHLFDKEGVELNIDADYGHITNNQEQLQEFSFYGEAGEVSEPDSRQRSNLPQVTDIWSAKIDYQHPISEKMYWDAGIKASGNVTDNDMVYENLVNNTWQNDLGRSNYFKYTENIYAAYANWGHDLGKVGYQLGVRAEYTWQKGEQLTTREVNMENYFKLFSTLFLNYNPGENHVLGLSYTRRIRRPNYQAMNPFEVVLDNYTYVAGNPYLKPQYSNNIDVRYTFYQKLTATLTWTYHEKMMLTQPVFRENDSRYGYVYDNFGNRTAYVFMINYNDRYFNFWRMNFMGQLAYIKNKSKNKTDDFNNDGISGAIWMGNNFRVTKTVSAELNLLLLPVSRIGYSKSETLYNNLSLGISKNILGDKATLNLSANDLLNGQSSKEKIRLNDITIFTRENHNSRSVTFSFSYRFGSNKSKGVRNRDIGIGDELERTQGLNK